ncbi:glycosyltransferase family 4 protein [Roseivirga seohaensis]|uniref:glycosyltransferase family 4 protein n=1 Tax=Roseivirga seohaensis TaxID=1914963 RepID=UPI003BAC1090
MKIILINAHYTHILGGSEIQCHQIAQGLTELGIDLTYLAVGGYNDAADLPYKLLRVEKNAPSIIKACKELQPDLIYWRFNKNLLASVIDEVKALKIKLVFSVSHIHDLEPFAYKPIPNLSVLSRTKRRLTHLVKGIQFQKAFKKMDGVICNNEEHLKHISHSNKVYIPNSPFLEYEEFTWPRPYVVWVGNIKAHKYPELFVELAKSLTGIGVDFLMVGDIQQQAYEYLNTSKRLPRNFHFLGSKSVFETNGIIKSSMFLVHTCEPEGFPNVFLQAWGFSKPIVSLQFDPAGLLEKHKIGFYSKNYQQFVRDCSQLITESTLTEQIGKKANKFLDEHFMKERNIKQLMSFLSTTLEQ